MSLKESGFIVVMECPLWVKSGHDGAHLRCPLYPQKQTLLGDGWMSALCQKQTFRPIRSPRQRGKAVSRVPPG
jgi:hypothetical protein